MLDMELLDQEEALLESWRTTLATSYGLDDAGHIELELEDLRETGCPPTPGRGAGPGGDPEILKLLVADAIAMDADSDL